MLKRPKTKQIFINIQAQNTKNAENGDFFLKL